MHFPKRQLDQLRTTTLDYPSFSGITFRMWRKRISKSYQLLYLAASELLQEPATFLCCTPIGEYAWDMCVQEGVLLSVKGTSHFLITFLQICDLGLVINWFQGIWWDLNIGLEGYILGRVMQVTAALKCWAIHISGNGPGLEWALHLQPCKKHMVEPLISRIN